MKLKIFSLLFISLLFTSCNSQEKGVETISPAMYADKLKSTPKAQLLDVRSPEEYSGQHLKGAANVDWNGGDFEVKAGKYDKSKPIFVYCMVGGRSKKAANKLHSMGFTQIYDLQGGIMKWDAEKYPTVKANESKGMDIVEYNKMLSTDKKVLIDFYAEWCGPCKKMEPFLKQMTTDMQKDVTIIRIDVDKNKELAQHLNIDALPTLIIYDDKKPQWRHVGFISEDDLKKQLK